MNKYELEEQAIDCLKGAIEYSIENESHIPTRDDLDLNELADSVVPVYTGDLLTLALNDYGTFGWVDDEQVKETIESLADIIMWNAYQFVYQVMNEQFDKLVEEIETDLKNPWVTKFVDLGYGEPDGLWDLDYSDLKELTERMIEADKAGLLSVGHDEGLAAIQNIVEDYL